MYTIIDIETTGLSPKNSKIIEIALIKHDGKNETERFTTLINPEVSIPYRITKITGINNAMIQQAPKFYEVARKIIEFTQDSIIVGHNVSFDYNFLRAEFAEFDYDFRRKTLCTVRLSRKAFPGLLSYSLKNITRHLGIQNRGAHRAEGDAEATVRLFEMILKSKPDITKIKSVELPRALPQNIIDKLPEQTGVYYFLNSKNDVIYVGKSKNIKKRILTHLGNQKNGKAVAMSEEIADVKYKVTGSELVALLLESQEIKKIRPKYNRALIRSVFPYGLFVNINGKGFFELSIEKAVELDSPLTGFSSKREAKNFLEKLCDDYRLCLKMCGLHHGDGPCFNYHLHKCDGACAGKEAAENYNAKVSKALDRLSFKNPDFFIVEPGRTTKEIAVVQVMGGIYKGYGYTDVKNKDNREILAASITPGLPNKDHNNIILNYIRNINPEIISP